LKLAKISDDVFELHHAGKPEFEFERKAGKWHVQCKMTPEKKEFDTLQDAVEYVAQSIYKEELKKLIGEKVKQQKKAVVAKEKFLKKHPSGEKSSSKEVNANLNQHKAGIEGLLKIANDEKIKVNKTIIRSMMSLLRKFK
jgi:hypothetical protein